MNDIEIEVPDIGDFSEVEIIEVLVKPGDDISVEQSLVTVESDKASMEIPSPAAGKLRELKVKIGDKVAKGSVIALLDAGEGKANGKAAADADAKADAGADGKADLDGEGDAKADAKADSGGDASAGAGSDAPAPSAPAASATAPRAEAKAGDAAAAGASGSGTEVQVPDIGDFDQVEVIEVLVAAGDTVALEQSLITVESDKASMEIPSSAAGKVARMLVKVGDKVGKGSPVALIESQEAGPGPQAAAAPKTAAAPPAEPPAARSAVPSSEPAGSAARDAESSGAEPAGTGSPDIGADGSTAGVRAHPVPADMRDGKVAMKPHASPSVRRFARELGVDLALVDGTGSKKRITPDDVRSFVKQMVGRAAAMPGGPTAPGPQGGAALGLIPWPKVDFAKHGEVEVKPLSRIKKISGANLHRNWVMIPHVTNHEDADITDLEAFRLTLNAESAGSGVKVTMLAFLIKVCVAALKRFPEFNSSLDGDSLVYKKYFHVGFAADTPNGLVVPVIRDADRKGLLDIAAEMAELARKARDGKLGPAEMQGGTFSVSSLGGIGGTYFTPIINAPEVAILGVCRSIKRPVWNEDKGAFEPRLILPLSLSWDHRVIDGAAAARFNTHLAQLLADFRRVSL